MLKLKNLKNSFLNCLLESAIFKILKQVFIEFCSNSSIHGVRYIVEPGIKVFERFFWFCLVVSSLVAALLIAFRSDNLSMYYIRDYIKSIHYPTYMATQPAMTFCNGNFRRSRAEKLVNLMSVPPHFNRTALMEDFHMLQLLIDTSNVNIDDLDFNKLEVLQSILNDNSLPVETVIRQLIQPCSELFVQCRFGNSLIDCSKIVRSVKTDNCFCCSLNYIPPLDSYNFNSEFDGGIYKDEVLFRNYGFDSGHSFLLNISVHDQLNYIYPASGIEIYVHYSTQYPRLFSVGTLITHGWETFVRLSISLRHSAPLIRYIRPRSRECYFDDEIQLKYFKFYSYSNCIAEARMDFIVSKCGCLPVTFPNQDIHGYTEGVYVKLNGVKYTCFNMCNRTIFSLSTSAVEFTAPQMNAYKYFDNINTTGLTMVHLFRDSPSVILYYREPASYFWDMVAAVGGVFGIFLGINFFSIVELFYFFIIRLLQLMLNH